MTFKESPLMSAYLLAFKISKLNSICQRNDTFCIWARQSTMNQTAFCLEEGALMIEKLSEIFDYSYYDSNDMNMEKMDMVAVPDIIPGGMENWGLITYKETGLLYDKNHTSAMAQQKISAVIAHELAHQWFGNLVTMNWWNDTWLNEAFARYLQYFLPSLLHSEWEMNKQFVVEQLQVAFIIDATDKTHPLSHKVETPEEANAIFDNISYNKGSSIVRMFADLYENDIFFYILQKYLRNFAFESVSPFDLYKTIQEHTNIDYCQIKKSCDIQYILRPWIEQSGYPVVYVTVDSKRQNVYITQRRFLLYKPTEKDETKWPIHLTYMTAENLYKSPKKMVFFDSTNSNLTITFDKPFSWIIFNLNQFGYYRVHYDEQSWLQIKEALLSEEFGKISDVNRAQIVDDLLSFARAGDISYSFVMKFLLYLKNETNYLPWMSAFNGFSFILSRLRDSDLDLFYVINMNVLIFLNVIN